MLIIQNGIQIEKINQYYLNGNLIKKWSSMLKIEKELHISRKRIARIIKNKTYKADNYIWRAEKVPIE